ncbi:lysophospholipase [Belliella sp. R4-6]|uniref:Lysophospholipase n=1 Tax=Belliella alkalica TaxID=1730871 RepID=A0ABS9V8X8_9BACT|nr:alpha/beta fold hydrolase [Belliella alkalica]MCH7412879.1 lysophospholipase [Belliella alkalica]
MRNYKNSILTGLATHKLNNVKVFLVFVLFCSIVKVHAINPDREYIRTPDSLGLNYESLRIKTNDGFDINTWVYSANVENDNGKLIILAYPDAGNMSYFVYHSSILVSHGYTVVTFDYRGFGKSSDFSIERDMLYYKEFATDLIAVGDFIYQKFPNKKIGIWGMSMGSIIAVKAIEKLQDKISFLVVEGFVTNVSLITERIEKQKGVSIIQPEKDVDYIRSIESLNLPILIFSASKDEITPTEDVLKFRNSTRNKCEVISFEGERLSGFNSGEGEWGSFYINQINKFTSKISV